MSGRKAPDKDALKQVLMENTYKRRDAGIITRDVEKVELKALGTMKVGPLRETWKARMDNGQLDQEDQDKLDNLVGGEHTEDEDYEPPLGGQPPPLNPPLPDAVIYHAERNEIPEDGDTFTVTKTVTTTYKITLGEGNNAARAIEILNGLK
tara:strand:- start:71 stop:523 length:453 start_codon:yes stop_codon:yes gene_type:complete